MRISDWSSDVCSSDLAAPGRPLAAVEPGPPRAPQRGRGLRPRQPRLQREGPAQVRRQGRPRRADLGNRDARETAAAFRSDLADREEAVMAPDPGTARKPYPSRGGLGGDGLPPSPAKTPPPPVIHLDGEGDNQ